MPRVPVMLVLVIAMLADGHHSADAAGVVGTGTPESCTGNALAAALTGGGTVTFDCGPATATILVDTAVIQNGVIATVDGGNRIRLDGESLRQIFFVLAGGQLTLRNITLRHGFAGVGGAIRNDGTALLERVNLSDNQADGVGGGAIYNVGALEIYDSTFFANSAPSDGAAGGALLNILGAVGLRRCLFANNFAELGGGIAMVGGSLNLSNDTFTSNSADNGGALFIDSGDAQIANVTFDRNNADHGGALFREVAVVMSNSVLARSLNRQQNSQALECDGTGASITSHGGNLAEDGSCQFDQITDQNLTEPELGDLADNGGPTLTIMPLSGSPLIDGGVSDGCEETDQRGAARPFDGDDDDVARCDIGAVEVPEPAAMIAAAAAVSALATARARRRRSRNVPRLRRRTRGRHLQRAIGLACLTRLLVAPAASADVVMYSWSGRVEPLGANPWSLLGDGSAVTADGTPFRIRALVALDAVDLNGTLIPNFAQFSPILLLSIGDELTPVTNPEIHFSDDSFGTLDSITLQTSATRLGTTLSMSSNMRVPITAFALSDAPAPDLPPVFTDTTPIQFGGAATPSLLTVPDNATVTGRLQICGESPTPVSWTSVSTGSAGEIEVTLANLGGAPILNPADYEMQGPDFAAGPLCSTTPQIDYANGADWSATLSAPVGALLVYAKFWRGAAGGVDPVTHQFDAPFTIVSGFAQASVGNGNTLLTLSGAAFHDGILRFEGPIASLAVETNSTSSAEQAMTLAVLPVPEPDAAAGAVAALALLVARAARSSRRIR